MIYAFHCLGRMPSTKNDFGSCLNQSCTASCTAVRKESFCIYRIFSTLQTILISAISVSVNTQCVWSGYSKSVVFSRPHKNIRDQSITVVFDKQFVPYIGTILLCNSTGIHPFADKNSITAYYSCFVDFLITPAIFNLMLPSKNKSRMAVLQRQCMLYSYEITFHVHFPP